KVFAVDALGGVSGLPVSRALLKIVRAQPGAGGPPPTAQQHAGAALVARKDRAAVPLMLEALAEHYDFLDDRQPRGVDVMARALRRLLRRRRQAHAAAGGAPAARRARRSDRERKRGDREEGPEGGRPGRSRKAGIAATLVARPVPKKYTILVCRGPECGDKRH